MEKEHSVFLILLTLTVFATGCQTESAPRIALSMAQPNLEGAPYNLGPGVHQHSVVRPDGTLFRYSISLPKDYDPSQALPMVIALHHAGDATPFFGERMISMICRPAFRYLPAIIVAPDGNSAGWTSEQGEQTVLMTYDDVVKNFNIDENKTLLTGYGMGGQGTWYIAGRHQDLFKAAIPIASQPDKSTSEWTTPVYAIHSRKDQVIPVAATRKYVSDMRKTGADMILRYTQGNFPHDRPDLYAKPLRDALGWLEEVWAESSQP